MSRSEVDVQGSQIAIVADLPARAAAIQLGAHPLNGATKLAQNGGSEDVSITFQPMAAGSFEANLIVTRNNLPKRSLVLKGSARA